jgi:ATP-dependent DNA helicase DinG
MLAIATLEGVPVLPPHDAVVVDEGHELVDRATSAVTVELSAALVERAVSRSRRLLDPDLAERLDEAAEAVAEELLAQVGPAGSPVRIEKVAGSMVSTLAALRDVCHAAVSALGPSKQDDGDSAASRSRARAALEEVHDVAGRLLALDEHDVAWIDSGEQRAPVLRLAPLSVAGLLRTALFDAAPVVITSATLALGGGFDATAASLGLAGDPDVWTALDVGSPFDFRSQGILYVARRLPPPGRDGVPEEALDELAGLVEAAGGRTLALFSSWRGVQRAAERLRVWLDDPAVPLLVQQRGDSVADLVARFAAEPRSVLLGTMSLWQGVDVPGDSCTLVVIDRLPFPRPDDPLQAARAARVDASGGNGFMAVSVPRAALLLAQGAGRLVRSRDDRGVVAVLDPRLATARYSGYLRASLPDFWTTDDGTVVRAALARLHAAALERESGPGPAGDVEPGGDGS